MGEKFVDGNPDSVWTIIEPLAPDIVDKETGERFRKTSGAGESYAEAIEKGHYEPKRGPFDDFIDDPLDLKSRGSSAGGGSGESNTGGSGGGGGGRGRMRFDAGTSAGGGGLAAGAGVIGPCVLIFGLILFGYIAAQWRPPAGQRPAVSPSPAPTATAPDPAPGVADRAPLDPPAQAERAQQPSPGVGPIGFASSPLTAEEEYWLRVRNVQGRATGPSDPQRPQPGSNGEGAPGRAIGSAPTEPPAQRQISSDLARERYQAAEKSAFDRYGEIMERTDCFRDHRTCEEAERVRNAELMQARHQYEAERARISPGQ